VPLLPSIQKRAKEIVGELYPARYYRDVQIVILRVHLWACPLCNKGEVGRIDYKASFKYSNGGHQSSRTDKVLLGVAAVCVDGNRICNGCEEKFRRVPPSKLRRKSRAERKHDRAYKKFLAGGIWPEIEVTITTADGRILGRTGQL